MPVDRNLRERSFFTRAMKGGRVGEREGTRERSAREEGREVAGERERERCGGTRKSPPIIEAHGFVNVLNFKPIFEPTPFNVQPSKPREGLEKIDIALAQDGLQEAGVPGTVISSLSTTE